MTCSKCVASSSKSALVSSNDGIKTSVVHGMIVLLAFGYRLCKEMMEIHCAYYNLLVIYLHLNFVVFLLLSCLHVPCIHNYTVMKDNKVVIHSMTINGRVLSLGCTQGYSVRMSISF